MTDLIDDEMMEMEMDINEEEGQNNEEVKEEEGPELDSEGNPINLDDLLPKEIVNPLKKETLQKALSKISRTYGTLSII
jgi:hypothetical protein